MKICSGLVLALGIVGAIAVVVFAETLGFVYFSVILFAAILLALLFKGIGESIRLQQQLIDIKLLESKKGGNSMPETRRSFPETQPSAEQQFANAPPVQQAYSTYIVNQ